MFLLVTLVFVFLLLVHLNLNISTPERLTLPPRFFLINASFFFAVPNKLNPEGGKMPTIAWTIKAGLAITFFLTINTFSFISKQYAFNRERKYYEEVHDNSLADFHPQSTQLYVVWDSAFPYELIHAFDSFEMLRNFNTTSLAYYRRSPFAHHFLEQFHAPHLFRDLVDRPDIFLLCTPSELKLYFTYMQEHYQMEVHPGEVFKSPFAFSIYRIHTIKSQAGSHSHG